MHIKFLSTDYIKSKIRFHQSINRFDCKGRQYKYYFPKSNLNITAMREACRQLVGSHDFRHLCKMDVGNGVTEFTRRVVSADIIALDKDCEQSTYWSNTGRSNETR